MLGAAALNSSGAMALLTVGLVQARLMSLRGAIAVILGANVGTTVVPQLLASPVAQAGIPLAGIGAIVSLAAPWPRVRGGGRALLGFGLVMTGLGSAASSFTPLTRGVDWHTVLQGTRGTLAGLGMGTVMALALQSGNAGVAVLQNAAAHGAAPLRVMAPVVMGINLGSSLPTLAAAILTASPDGRRVALFHVLCNMVGIAALMPFADSLATISTQLSTDPARQVAHLHSLFNLATTTLELPFVPWWERLCLWLVPAPSSGPGRPPRSPR